GQSLIALAPYLELQGKVLPALEILAAARSPLFPDKIVELLDAPQAPVRRAALRVLVNHDQMDVEEHLVRKLQDPDESVRIEAVELLVRNGSTRAVPALVGLLVVSDELRYHAIRALGRLHAETAAAELERLFPRATGHERLETLAALIRIGAPGLLPFPQGRLKDPVADVRRVAPSAAVDGALPGEAAASFFMLAWRPCPYVFWIRRSGRALARRLARAGARDFADGPRAEARARAFRTENVAGPHGPFRARAPDRRALDVAQWCTGSGRGAGSPAGDVAGNRCPARGAVGRWDPRHPPARPHADGEPRRRSSRPRRGRAACARARRRGLRLLRSEERRGGKPRRRGAGRGLRGARGRKLADGRAARGRRRRGRDDRLA